MSAKIESWADIRELVLMSIGTDKGTWWADPDFGSELWLLKQTGMVDGQTAGTVRRMKAFLQAAAAPGVSITAGVLKTAVIDGAAVTDAVVTLGGSVTGITQTTILQYPVLGDVEWA